VKGCISDKDLNKFLDDSIDPETRSYIEAHAGRCASCARELEAWKKLKAGLHEISLVELPEGFKKRVMDRVGKEKIAREPAGDRMRRGFALAFVAFVLLYIISRSLFGQYMDIVSGYILRSVSTFLYTALDSVGIDPSAVIGLFGGIMSRLDVLIPFFAVSTLLLVISFLLLVLRGKKGRRQA
jgi:hypothetical protein